MLDALTSEQISEWQAYDRLDPIDESRNDIRTALLCTVITNIARALSGQKGTKSASIEDFLLKWDAEDVKDKETQSVEEMKSILLSLANIHKAKK